MVRTANTRRNDMKLGTETGSIVNHMYSMATIGQPEVFIGMPVTVLSWTDRHPATVIETFKSGKFDMMHIQRDDYKVVPRENAQYGDHIEYTYSPNPDGFVYTYKKNSDGRWFEVILRKETGRWVKCGNGGIRLGVREEYWDPSF